MVFVVEHWTTNILPTNKTTLPTFTCSASSNHENKNHELTNIFFFSNHRFTVDHFPQPVGVHRIGSAFSIMAHNYFHPSVMYLPPQDWPGKAPKSVVLNKKFGFCTFPIYYNVLNMYSSCIHVADVAILVTTSDRESCKCT